jgi:hypothetical protein
MSPVSRLPNSGGVLFVLVDVVELGGTCSLHGVVVVV